MHIPARDPGDPQALRRLVRSEPDAKQRDRCRAALLALEGLEAPDIAARLGRSRRFVQRWAYAYRDGGIGAITPKRQPGRTPKLPRDRQAGFKGRMLAGPAEADGGVCTLRGRQAVAILGREFGVSYSLNGAYGLLHRLGLSCLKPRPRHRKADADAQRRWLDEAPLLSGP